MFTFEFEIASVLRNAMQAYLLREEVYKISLWYVAKRAGRGTYIYNGKKISH